MFKSIGRSLPDFSTDVRDREDWDVGTLRTLDQVLDAVSLAFDPVSSILAVGTIGGSIRIFGAPGVDTSLSLSSATPVKFLQFATNIFKLICIDENDKLYLWDITPHGQIKLEASIRLERPVTCLTLSPSHTHAFLGLEHGEIKTYDLLCRRISTYAIPNAWEIYEKELISSGMLVDTEGTSRVPVDVIVHPRDLNFVFIAYGGGVVLFDLKGQKTVKTYELLIPAGAPGGSGYTDPDLLKHRRPGVSSLSIHPAGHFFAVGHIDGSIAFWAVEDDEQPLMVRTLDDIDVQKVDGEKLEEYLPDDEDPTKHLNRHHEPREPIFKLAWSGYPNSYDPRGGETSLVILGGQFSRDPSGVNVLWLPAFNPPAPPTSPANDQPLHPFFRTRCESASSLSALLLSHSGLPAFRRHLESHAILMLFEGEEHTRAIEAQQFPPLEFLAAANSIQEPPKDTDEDQLIEAAKDAPDALTDDLATTLQALSVHEEPKKLNIPPSLWSGPDAIVNATLFSLDRIAYETLSGPSIHSPNDLLLEGGIAVPDEEVAGTIKYAKFEPHRIVITQNADLTVRFLDISVQLLIPTPSSPFTSAFPRVLPNLTIDVLALIGSPEVTAHTPPGFAEHARIEDVQFTGEALEVGIVLTGGEVVVYRMVDRQNPDARQLSDRQLVSLEHIPVAEGLRFKPYFMVKAEAPLTALAMSDIGFVAAAYANGALCIIDMRGPRIMLHATKPQPSHRHSFMHRNSASADAISSLAWSISGIKQGSTYTLARSADGAWSAPPAPYDADGVPAPLPGGTFVLDARTGAPCRADKARLAVALEHARAPAPAQPDAAEDAAQSLLLVVGARGARCAADFGEERVARAEWGARGGAAAAAVRAQVVERNGTVVRAGGAHGRHEAAVYALPTLEHLHALPLPGPAPYAPSLDRTGDLLTIVPLHTPAANANTSTHAARASSPTPSAGSTAARSVRSTATAPAPAPPASPARRLRLDTLFNVRRGYHTPLASLTARRDGGIPQPPPAPAPVGLGPAGWRAWLGGLGDAGRLGDERQLARAGSKNMVAQAKLLATKQTAKSWLPKF
ncbi:hypothetical protein BC834DRAFT_965566 [Gloeopeniophorella convolvens]|nr:hypothetical protein BC834DRAFT_965566 [Gloeopeniophorella convolvens]